jgi:hypothetical protein
MKLCEKVNKKNENESIRPGDFHILQKTGHNTQDM